eukprot:2874737-Amphidinium_carterae.1
MTSRTPNTCLDTFREPRTTNYNVTTSQTQATNEQRTLHQMHYNEKVNYKYSTTVCRSYNCDEFKDTADDSTIISRSRTLRNWDYGE